MVESLVLLEGDNLSEENLMIPLSNAKQLLVGKAPGGSVILHVAANSSTDLGNALLKFTQIPNVTGAFTLTFQTL